MAVPKKNILLIIADDLGRDLSIYGHHNTARTPNLEKLASEGTVFKNAFASTASCSGSRSTIYTGLHTHQNGQYGLLRGFNFLHYFTTFKVIETHPKIFNELGYLTGINGKLHVGPPKSYPYTVNAEAGTRDCKLIAERFENFISRAQDEGIPWFETIGYHDPHRDGSRGGWANGPDYPGIEKHVYDPDMLEVPNFLTDIPEVRKELAEYYQAIDRMDQGIGMLMDVLTRKGEMNNTLVVFVSDNGPPFVNSKTTLFDAGVRLPMAIRCPGQKGGIRNPNLVSFIDLLPTFLDWSGNRSVECTNPRGKQRIGRSLLPVLELEQPHEEWGYVFGSHTFHEPCSYYPTRFLRNHKYKYHRNIAWQMPFPFGADLYGALSFEAMRNFQPDGPKNVKLGHRLIKDYIHRPPEMLFDVENDPNEIHNLASKPEYEKQLLKMRCQLEEWQRETGDQWLFRDGISLGCVDRHLRNGCKIPDRFDFDVSNPGSNDVPLVKKKDRLEYLK